MDILDVKIGLLVRNKKTKTLVRILDIPKIISRVDHTEHKAVYYKENKTNITYVDTIHTFAEIHEVINTLLSNEEIINFTL